MTMRRRMTGLLVMSGLFLSLLAAEPSFAYEKLFETYARQYDLPAELLMAIAKTESGFSPSALNIEGKTHLIKDPQRAASIIRQNRGRCINVGMMQIDGEWFSRKGLDPAAGLDPARNVAMGAKILRDCIKRYGRTWKAVAAYNSAPRKSRGKRYAEKVGRNLKKIVRGRIPGKPGPLPDGHEGRELIDLVLSKNYSKQAAFK